METRSVSTAREASRASGTAATREFYDREGWTERAGATVDAHLFGFKEDGPIRQELMRLRTARVRRALTSLGDALNVLECGCGGQPDRTLLGVCRHYTGTDFSSRGLELAARRLTEARVPHALHQADVCELPFENGAFDAVYSAHMIYHLADPAAQRVALKEMMRVLRPGGLLLLIAANPRPLLFPLRLARRVIADTPIVGAALHELRPKPPLPYRPMSFGWMTRELRQHGDVEVLAHAVPSVEFHRGVSEHRGIGRLLWRGVRAVETDLPALSAYLGSFVLYKATRR